MFTMVDVYGSQILMEYIYIYMCIHSGTLYMLTQYGCTWPQADDAPEAYRLAAQALLALWIATPKGLKYQW